MQDTYELRTDFKAAAVWPVNSMRHIFWPPDLTFCSTASSLSILYPRPEEVYGALQGRAWGLWGLEGTDVSQRSGEPDPGASDRCLCIPSPTMPIESIQAQRPSFPHDLRVLLCDTEEAARKEALQLLTSCKYAVTECASAEECASLAAAGEFDIIIIDVSCFSDETAAQQSAAIFALGTPCALTFTAPACPKVHALTAGCVDVLEKPLVLTRCSTLWMHLVSGSAQ